jgi:hypothetical protein
MEIVFLADSCRTPETGRYVRVQPGGVIEKFISVDGQVRVSLSLPHKFVSPPEANAILADPCRPGCTCGHADSL